MTLSIREQIAEHEQCVAQLHAMANEIERAARTMYDVACAGGTIYWLGNGGSAADAQHLSAELMGRFVTDRRGIKSFALTTDSSLMTAVANDYNFTRVFARQIETVVRPGDLVVVISTSGNSANIIAAAQAAQQQGAQVLGLTGATGGRLKEFTTQCLCIPSTVTARVQECHELIGHIMCDRIDAWVAQEK
jgi:D-sedoheptulose 7-phosphate isomerase